MRETKSLAKADVLARFIGGVSMASVPLPKLDATSTTVVEAALDEPALAAMDPAQITHRELIDRIIAAEGWKPGAQTPMDLKSRANAWCKALSLTLDDPARRSLDVRYAARLNAVTLNIEKTLPGKKDASRSIRWAAARMKKAYDSLCADSTLSMNFSVALKTLMDAKGWTVRNLTNAVHAVADKRYDHTQASLQHFLDGTKAPRYPGSIEFVARIEKALEAEPGVLHSRAFRRPQLILLGTNQPIDYRIGQSLRSKSHYAKDLPPQIAEIFLDIVDWRSEPTVEVDGEDHVQEGCHWTGNGSPKKYKANLRRLIGFMLLPKAQGRLSALPDKVAWESGLGMKVKDITFAHLFDVQILRLFLAYLRGRTKAKTDSQDAKHLIGFLNSLVNHPYSYVRAHPALAPIFGKRKSISKTAWVAHVETIHQELLKLNRRIDMGTRTFGKGRHRDPIAPLVEVFAADNPMDLFWQMVDRMEEDMRGKVLGQQWCGQLRDIAMFRMELEVPLRSFNLAELALGDSLNRNKETGIWTVFVPKAKQKNRHSKYALDIHRKYSKLTSQAIDRYVNDGRPRLQNAGVTNLAFLPTKSGPPRKVDPKEDLIQNYPVRPDLIYWIVARCTRRYFGISIGPNVFRHLIATACLQKDPTQLFMVAAFLNNSPDTVKKTYGYLLQKHDLTRGLAWLEEQRRDYVKKKVMGLIK